MSEKFNRRNFIKGSVAAAGFISLEEKILLAAMEKGIDVKKEKGKDKCGAKVPVGKIGGLTISRLILGGNLIGGWAHSRDLIYVSELFKAYNTDEKVFETLALAEQRGINTIIIILRSRCIKKYCSISWTCWKCIVLSYYHGCISITPCVPCKVYTTIIRCC